MPPLFSARILVDKVRPKAFCAKKGLDGHVNAALLKQRDKLLHPEPRGSGFDRIRGYSHDSHKKNGADQRQQTRRFKLCCLRLSDTNLHSAILLRVAHQTVVLRPSVCMRVWSDRSTNFIIVLIASS